MRFKKYFIFLLILLLSVIFVLAFLSYILKHERDGWPKKGECGGGVSIYVNNLENSENSLKNNFTFNNWVVRTEYRKDLFNVVYDVQIPINQTVKLLELLRKESSNKIVYGEKVLNGFEGDQLKDCNVYIANLEIIDVKALSK